MVELAYCQDDSTKDCDYCSFDKKRVSAEARCLECRDNLCQGCWDAHHRTKLTRDHKVAPFKEIRNRKYDSDIRRNQHIICTEHKEKLQAHCNSCDVTICRECSINKHRNHTQVNLEEAAGLQKRHVDSLLKGAKSRKLDFKQQGQFLAAYKMSIEDNRKRSLAHIEEQAGKLHGMIDDHKKALVEKINTTSRKETDRVSDKYTDTLSVLGNMQDNILYIDKLQQHGTECEILDAKNAVVSRLHHLNALHVQPLGNKVGVQFLPGSDTTKNVEILFGKVEISDVASGEKKQEEVVKNPINIMRALPDLKEGSELVLEFNSKGHTDKKDIWPTGIDTDSEGNITVLDRENKRVKIFSNKGKLLRELGHTGKHVLNCPYDLAVMSDGNIVVTDYGDEDLKIFASSGSCLRVIKGTFKYPRGVAITHTGSIVVVDCHNRQLSVHDPKTGLLQRKIDGRSGEVDKNSEVFTDPYYVATNASGHILVTDWAAPNIKIFDHTGRYLTKYGTYGVKQDQILQPYGVCVDQFGYIFVADNQNHRIHLLDPTGKFIRFLLTKADGLWHPMAVAMTKEGQLVVTEALGKVKIFNYL